MRISDWSSDVCSSDLLVGAPAEFGWLQPLGDEALDRPSVPELVHRPWLTGALGIALGDVDALHAEALHEPCPILAAGRRARIQARLQVGVSGDELGRAACRERVCQSV